MGKLEVFIKDKTAGFMTRPLEFLRPLSSNPSKKVFVVHTWFLVPYLSAPSFAKITGPVVKEIPSAQGLIAWSVGNKMTMHGVVFETFSIWEERSDMANFFKSPVHQNAMAVTKQDLADKTTFGIRRMFIDVDVIPASNPSYSNTREFFSRIKNNEFELAPSPPKQQQ